MTIVTIAHRLITIQNCSRIVMMKHGKVQEEGTHELLMMNKGAYWRLVNKNKDMTR